MGAALWNEVKDHLHQSAYSLSGGQRQRLCIARALVVNPEVLLLDEPCSALDPIATAKIEELCSLQGQCTIVIVTHNLQQAARVTEYTGFFLMGRLIEFDETTIIFKKPAKKATAAGGPGAGAPSRRVSSAPPSPSPAGPPTRMLGSRHVQTAVNRYPMMRA